MIWKTNLVITDKDRLDMDGYRNKLDMLNTYLSCDKDALVKLREKHLTSQYPWLTGDRLKKLATDGIDKLSGIICY